MVISYWVLYLVHSVLRHSKFRHFPTVVSAELDRGTNVTKRCTSIEAVSLQTLTAPLLLFRMCCHSIFYVGIVAS